MSIVIKYPEDFVNAFPYTIDIPSWVNVGIFRDYKPAES